MDDNHSIGIVTFTFGTNYGCHLQRYALQTVCERLGFRPRAILVSEDALRQNKLKRAEHRVKRFLKFVCPIQFYDSFFDAQNRRQKAFHDFERAFLRTTKKFHSYASIKANASFGFDAWIAGSDQIWNPFFTKNPTFYDFFMLDFAPNEKKVAYAPSIGVSRIADKYVERFRRLSSFRFLSTREFEGSRELERILGREVPTVVDPTLLLTSKDWDVVAIRARPLETSRYILCYSLGNLEPVLRRAKAVQKTLHCEIVFLEEDIKTTRAIKKIGGADVIVAKNAGPCEFVNYVKHAECVVTDSYHGTIFSIVYRRPFFTMKRDIENAEKSMNSRIFTLFSMLQLENRLFDPSNEQTIAEADLYVDYDNVKKLLQERVEFSLNYLKNALYTTAGKPNVS
ncbi:MAG: polysaccharide pyruvyl transferase family protein [Thermoguttaceae bacterium]|nr:polysaccharide pyruvyl transferase family protein [Thermoguttaceae bacterium]